MRRLERLAHVGGVTPYCQSRLAPVAATRGLEFDGDGACRRSGADSTVPGASVRSVRSRPGDRAPPFRAGDLPLKS
jgi:hypothetical protein